MKAVSDEESLAERVGAAVVGAAVDVCIAHRAGCPAARIDASIAQAFAGAAVCGARTELTQRQTDRVTLLVDPAVARATVRWAGAGVTDTIANTKQNDGSDTDGEAGQPRAGYAGIASRAAREPGTAELRRRTGRTIGSIRLTRGVDAVAIQARVAWQRIAAGFSSGYEFLALAQAIAEQPTRACVIFGTGAAGKIAIAVIRYVASAWGRPARARKTRPDGAFSGAGASLTI